MILDIVTLFPGMFTGVFESGVISRAVEKGIIQIRLHDLRPFGIGKHRIVDDSPFGGGDGMVMMAEPIAKALESVLGDERKNVRVVLTTPQGKTFDQDAAFRLAKLDRIAIFCGRYAGVDERARKLFDEEISVGDYVLSGGEIAAMAMIDAVSRLIPGVLGNEDSPLNDSFPDLLEFAQYTRPRVWRGEEVPEILVNGDHEKIRRWREADSIKRTMERRPDLTAKVKEKKNQ